MMGATVSEFTKLRRLAARRAAADEAWAAEVRRLYESGAGGLRSIALHAGVSHDTVWKLVRGVR
jgi:hypothetical protein